MSFSDLNLKSGDWVVANCGKVPSDKNCQLVLMAPANQRNDLLDAAVAHAMKSHGHQDEEDIRQKIDQALENVQI